jgi:hypothetical protein
MAGQVSISAMTVSSAGDPNAYCNAAKIEDAALPDLLLKIIPSRQGSPTRSPLPRSAKERRYWVC